MAGHNNVTQTFERFEFGAPFCLEYLFERNSNQVSCVVQTPL